jgi:hypothetical protein
MNKRLIVVVSLVVVLVLAVTLVYLVTRNVPGTAVYVDPQTIVEGSGQDFTLNVRISGVSDLFAWQFRLSWDSSVLDDTSVKEGTFLNSSGTTFFAPQVNASGGYVLVDCTLLYQVGGVNGSGLLATMEFHVKNSGSCSIHLSDVILVNSQQQSIATNVKDGRFSSS